jgi:hypothetical protein
MNLFKFLPYFVDIASITLLHIPNDFVSHPKFLNVSLVSCLLKNVGCLEAVIILFYFLNQREFSHVTCGIFKFNSGDAI